MIGILISHVLILITALIHVWFMVLEMFLWDKPKGLKTFRMTQDFARTTKTLALNLGLYNGFLAVALIWGVVQGNQEMQLYGLLCVITAGLVGAASLNKKIFFVQALPAIITLIVFWKAQLT